MIVANREVENRPGNETDILVQCLVPEGNGGNPRRIAVVIETKGVWNNKLFKDIKDQLANRYLCEYEANIGIYVVGWFRSDCWDVGDSRRSVRKTYSIRSLHAALEQKAVDLSNEDRRIQVVVLDAALR
jgi:hypothetical protein